MDKIDTVIINYYLKNNLSVQQIADKSGFSYHKIKYILDKNGIVRRNINEAIRQLNVTKYNKKEYNFKKNLSDVEQLLKIAGVMLYWGEGTKAGRTVTISNSDPKMIKMFMRFLVSICGVDKKRVRAVLHYYSNQDESKLISHWSKVIGLNKNQFCKSFLHSIHSGSYKKTSEYGTLSLRYSDKKLLSEINGLIENYINEILPA
ncbi:MAG: hypothetical protein WCK11_03075 [Candidatus Falkowbacteria bacterium]